MSFKKKKTAGTQEAHSANAEASAVRSAALNRGKTVAECTYLAMASLTLLFASPR